MSQNTSKYLPAEGKILRNNLFSEITLGVIPKISLKKFKQLNGSLEIEEHGKVTIHKNWQNIPESSSPTESDK